MSSEETKLSRSQMEDSLSDLSINPFTHAHLYTTSTLSSLGITDIDLLAEFPNLHRVVCNKNKLTTLAPLQHLCCLVALDASENQLTQALDYVVPQCSEKNAWEEGKQWLGSLLRRANLRHNRIVYIPNLNLHHQYLQELYLDHNDITEIKGISTLRYLRVLSLSNNRLSSTKGLHPALEDHDSAEGGLFALEKLILSQNEITETPDLQGLPRLTELDLSHNRMKHLKSLSVCKVLQRLDLSSNEIENINELNHLMALKLLCKLNLSKSPIVEKEGEVFYRPRVLRRLQQIQHLDDDEVSAKEKVKALAMHGSELESRKEVFNKYLPGEQFTNCLPVFEFEEDKEIESFENQISAG